MSNKDSKSSFPTFKDGQVFDRPDNFKLEVGTAANVNDAYTRACYQFGMSTRPDMCQPAKVIYAENEEDISKAIKYAYEAGLALAVRSSGHHYQAYSSTNGENIQVDVSRMKTITQQGGANSVVWTVQAGCKLQDFDTELRKQEMFVPHGECSTVAVGGHIQTGGFSPSFSRSFGLFVDHAVEFTIVLAPEGPGREPVKKVVKKPQAGETDEMWYTILGGSPGNFGVITEVTFHVRKDKDHQHSRAIWFPFLYEVPNTGRIIFEALMKIACEYSDDEKLPSDYCFNVFMINGNSLKMEDLKKHKNIDTLMCHKHPEIYGPRGPGTPPWLGLSLVWCNVDGKCNFEEKDEVYGKSAKEVFDRVTAEVQGINGSDESFIQKLEGYFKHSPLNTTLHFMDFFSSLKDYTKFIGFAKLTPPFKPSIKDIPMSDLMHALSFPARIHGNPCLGATLLGSSTDLSKDDHKFSRWTAEIEDQGHWTKGIYPDCQWTFFGGKNNKFRPENCENNNVLAFRDTTICFLDYYHYDNVVDNQDVEAPFQITSQHVDQVVKGLAGEDGKSGLFGCDRRWMAFPNEDENLDELWGKYFNNKSDYLRVLKMKRMLDPTDVFTPNLFCVGASRKYKQAKDGSPATMSADDLSSELQELGNAKPLKKRKVDDL